MPQSPKRDIQWLIQAPFQANLADEMTDAELSALGSQVVRMYELDRQNRANWDSQSESAMKLAQQIKEAKTTPWQNAANVKHPLITSATIQFAARAYPEICKSGRVVKTRIVGDEPKAPKRPQMPPGMPPGMGQPGLPGPGPIAPGQQQLPGLPGPTGPSQPPMGPLGQIGPGPGMAQPPMGPQPQPPQPNPKRERADRIENHMNWSLTEEMTEWEADMDSLLHVLPVVGQCYKKTYFDPELGHNVSELVLPSECYVSKGKSRDIHKARRITHLLYKYENDVRENVNAGIWKDPGYLGKPVEDSLDEDAAFDFLEQHCYLDLDGDNYKEPYIVTVHNNSKKVVRVMARWQPESVKPARAKGKMKVGKIDQDNYFTHFGFIPNPDGSMNALGFGQLLEPINASVNTVVNQLLDSGTLANMGGGFIGRGLRMRGGVIELAPGEWKLVDVMGGSLRDNIFPNPNREPSGVLFQLLGFLVNAGKEISSVQEILTGDTKLAASMPVGTMMALVEQGLKVFTAIYKRIYRSLTSEFKKLYRLNAIHLNPKVTYDIAGQDQSQTVFQRDYVMGDTTVLPVADPDLSSDMQRLLKSQALKELSGRPGINEIELTRRLVRSVKPEDVERLLLTDGQITGQEPTSWRPPPNPQMITAQAKAQRLITQAQEDTIRLKMDAQKFAMEMESLLADIENKRADTMLKLAKAEASEAGSQLGQYRAEMEAIGQQVKMQIDLIKAQLKQGPGVPQGQPQPGPQPGPQGLQ